jgi:SpoVK/Ycf46/Vps4 family AAA+-type ATPase
LSDASDLTDLAPADREVDWQELRATLAQLDLRLRVTGEAHRDIISARAQDPFLGMRITDADVDNILAATPAKDIARRLLGEQHWPKFPRMQRLVQLFDLQPFEEEALLICLAPELDVSYGRLYAYLQDDATRRFPTVDLILRLLCPTFQARMTARSLLDQGSKLLANQLVLATEPPPHHSVAHPMLWRSLKVDERILAFLLGSDELDPRLAGYARFHRPASTFAAESTLPERMLGRLTSLLGSGANASLPGPIVYLHGPLGSGKLAAVRAACSDASRCALSIDVMGLLQSTTPTANLQLACREALLQQAVLIFDDFDRLLGDRPDSSMVRAALTAVLQQRFDTTVLLGNTRWEPASWLPEAATVRVELPAPLPSTRLDLWRTQVDGQIPPDAVADMAARYRLDADGIRSVVSAAWGQAVWRGSDMVDVEDFRAAARAITAPHLDGMALRIVPRYGWDDIVLARDGVSTLQELCARGRYHETVLERWGFGEKHARRAGVTALFAGPPGTGKSMAAEVIAGALGLELFRIDLSSVVSKYIGETEKNLEQIFRDADRGDSVLLFDEADALFGKRSEVRDAHDRYANVEVAYLLQRLETYDGIAILTTNLRGNLDEAFVRRLEYVLEFPLPEEPERLQIWQRALPHQAPLAADVDLPFLARRFRLSGGHIRNITVAAAFLAVAADSPIRMKDLVRATRREHQKIGKLVTEADFEAYGSLLKESL